MADMKDGAFKHDATVPPPSNRVLPLFSLKGKTAIVSGAGAGIGLQIAHAYAEAGANVAIWYNSNKKALDRAAEIEKEYGVKCKAYQVNVTSHQEIQESVQQIVSEFNGRLDIFVANSGIAWEEGPLIDGPMDVADRVMAVNVNGTIYCAQVAGEHFRRQKKEGTTLDGKKLEGFTYGSFIATASMSAHIVNVPQSQTVYNSSKAAVIHLCKSLAVEWVDFARVNTVSPGYIKTEISAFAGAEAKKQWKDKTPMGRREGEPGELKGAYLYLASDAASYTTGCDLVVDGGYCLP
ncbi:sorbitol utilization protein sou2 [Colletotrichum tofieldiae]|uniref:Sorbitol utilization protein sou2 (Short-chain dehydrogenase) n=2 Tax=Colletotrichum spaethianum species complex TaxID=2707349 RepID=A0A161WM80_9PEZI|nr:sorbitol utilization protein sou2 (short-chain dehydrogenase) [Colletotrichum tofieldiae]OHW90316.1 sorbitol utilization protein sou2 [Colletotrichum incanum]GJC81838.1 L-xylulose reductase [Colletotrichum liriopes]GKT58573.1 sorbitol utilization protein sou2 [Colletotrichum tofieldiae]GKT78009.1 sorbitol utilization protein sou2 [Colletotrichum tofieldiae]